MASITHDKRNGRRTVQFYDADGKRKSIRLGKATKNTAFEVMHRVESILAAKLAGVAIDSDTANWIGKLGPVIRGRLVAVGLVCPGTGTIETPLLGAFLDKYITDRTKVKPSTIIGFRQTANDLVAFFGADRRLADVTQGLAQEFRWDLEKTKALNTVRRRCGRAKQFFTHAKRHKFIAENPFEGMKDCNVKENRERDYQVSRDEARAVLDACPDHEWRLLFALCRYAGMRCPSEVLGLRWADVDWERERMTVTSPKTEQYEGKESRVVPIFPELKPHLEAAFEHAREGAVFVVCRYRDTNVNLRTQLTRIIRRAGLKVWPKLFHNLRATRETELAAEFPLHVVCEWIGNSQPVAARHYLRVTEADFSKAVRFPVLQGTESARTEPKGHKAEVTHTRQLPSVAASCSNMQVKRMAAVGLETSTTVKGETDICTSGGAISGAKSGAVSADLDRIIAAWPSVPDDDRKEILRIVRKYA